jgi:hypothetical protein
VLFWALLLFHALHRIRPSRAGRGIAFLAFFLIALLVCGLNIRAYIKGADHMHWQVVKWVQQNVAEEIWVGAIQTGTLGFYHDRTVNFDGKVNPEACRARIEGRLPQYVVNTEVRYLADWIGIREWMKHPEISAHFDVIVADREKNICVMRRKDVP